MIERAPDLECAVPELYSADSHVVEPPTLWLSRIDRRFREQSPRVVERDGTELWIVDDGRRMAVVGIQAQAGWRYDDSGERRITKQGYYRDILILDPEHYTRHLAIDGIAGAVLFPSNAHQAYRCIAGELLEAVARTYNDWILDFCAEDPARLKAVAMLPVDDVRRAIAELERTVAAGAVGAMIPILPRPGCRYDQLAYDPLWRAAAAMHVPMLMHVGANQAVLDREPPIDLIRHATKDVHVQASIATMVLSGIFSRHPALRIGAVEFGASWIVDLMIQLDRVVAKSGARWSRAADRLPSEQLRRNVFLSFQQDRAAIRWRRTIGIENLLWGNDFPHAESTYPRSRSVLATELAGVNIDDARRIVCDNTVDTFGFARTAARSLQSKGGTRDGSRDLAFR